MDIRFDANGVFLVDCDPWPDSDDSECSRKEVSRIIGQVRRRIDLMLYNQEIPLCSPRLLMRCDSPTIALVICTMLQTRYETIAWYDHLIPGFVVVKTDTHHTYSVGDVISF